MHPVKFQEEEEEQKYFYCQRQFMLAPPQPQRLSSYDVPKMRYSKSKNHITFTINDLTVNYMVLVP